MSYVRRGPDRRSRRGQSRRPLAALAPVALAPSTAAYPRPTLVGAPAPGGSHHRRPGRAEPEPGPGPGRTSGRALHLDRGPEPGSTGVRVDGDGMASSTSTRT